jgi:hypothetical protein
VTRRAPPSILVRTSESSGSLPTKELAGRGRLVFEIVLSGGKEPAPSWKIGIAPSMSFRRCSPRSISSSVPGSSNETVEGDNTTCPPCAALMILAARCTSMPTYFGGSRAGSPVWIPTRIRMGPPSKPIIASLTADTALSAEANA